MIGDFKKVFRWGTSTFGVAIFYIFGVLLFGETHPFSRFPMYSSFPNWSYSFYLANDNNDIIPLASVDTDGAALGHLYGSVAYELNIPYGEFMESEDDLRKIGDRMMYILFEDKTANHNYLKLYRKGFFYQNDTIQEITTLMTTYEDR
tara:strand:+ start:494 stop:937 length:444 start_codon:yes stop_codon:yes gene_type:complete